jgi:hypothetical protein
MNIKNIHKFLLLLVILFLISTSFVFSFSYPLAQKSSKPGTPVRWGGGVVPDEDAYFNWAQIYHETGETYVPLEELGRTKIRNYDFFLGRTPEDSIFANVEVTQVEHPKPGMKMQNRNITVTVFNGNNEPVSGARLKLKHNKLGLFMRGRTGDDGTYTFDMVRQGIFKVFVYTQNKPLMFNFATDYRNANYPIIISAQIINWSDTNVILNVHVDHFINPNIDNVDIFLGQRRRSQEPSGQTDNDGNFLLKLSHNQSRSYRVVGVKETKNIFPPFGSKIVYVDGEYAIANNWAPGYSYFIIPFWNAGLIDIINIFAFLIVCISTYLLAYRLYNQRTALIASVLVMASGIGMIMIFQRGMADYAAMAFATFGLALFIESIREYSTKRRLFVYIILGFLSGLSFAFAVTMRYATIIILIGPLVYITIKSIKEFKATKFTRIKRSLPSAIAFVIGLAVIGLILINYNAMLFDGPLNSGYQMGDSVKNIGSNSTISSPDKTMFEAYFNPSPGAIENIFDRILPQLFLLLPTLFIAPIGVCLDFKKSRTWLMAFWTIPILILYMQISWVGKLSVEDMRYFLPILPPTTILGAYAINKLINFENKKKHHKLLVIMPIILLILVGFLSAGYGINWLIHRRELGPSFEPPIIAIIAVFLAFIIIYFEITKYGIEKLTKPFKINQKSID